MNWRIIQLADAEFHIEVQPGKPIAIVQTAQAAVDIIVALRKAGQ